VSSGSKKAQRPVRRTAWESFDDVPVLPATAVLPTAVSAFADDVLNEIDMLLHEQDALFGFWQAPGE